MGRQIHFERYLAHRVQIYDMNTITITRVLQWLPVIDLLFKKCLLTFQLSYWEHQPYRRTVMLSPWLQSLKIRFKAWCLIPVHPRISNSDVDFCSMQPAIFLKASVMVVTSQIASRSVLTSKRAFLKYEQNSVRFRASSRTTLYFLASSSPVNYFSISISFTVVALSFRFLYK